MDDSLNAEALRTASTARAGFYSPWLHLATPSAFSETGAKGMGEGGTIGAPAAVLNAINDALSGTAVCFDQIPVLPTDLHAALASAGLASTGLASTGLARKAAP